MASNVDVVFNIAEGMAGRSREAQVPSLCELLGVPYTGSDSATLSICLDKALAKRLLVDVDTPAFQVLVTGREKLRAVPLPGHREAEPGGDEQGDHAARASATTRRGCARSRASSSSATGSRRSSRSTSSGASSPWGCSASGGRACCRRWRSCFSRRAERPVYDYECKQDWQKHVRYECPAKLTKDELRAVERACRATFMTLGCRDVARVDLRLTPEGRVYVIEVNPLPGLTPDYSDLCLIANGAKIDYRTLIGEILSGAIKRWQGRQRHEGRLEEAPREAASSPDVTATPEAAPVN